MPIRMRSLSSGLVNLSRFVELFKSNTPCPLLNHGSLKKVEPERLHPGAVLENGATLEGRAVFSLIIMFISSCYHVLIEEVTEEL